MLCGTSGAQSTFFSNERSRADTAAVPANSLPTPPVVHGFGVTNLSSYYPDSSFLEARTLAVEDLQANLFTSVYLESFFTTMLNTNYEFAIRDTMDRAAVVKADSIGRDGRAYYFVTIDSLETPAAAAVHSLRSLADDWTADVFIPVETEEYWIAAGYSRLSRFNPYRSWAESKLNALSSLARLIQTKVQSTTRHYNFFSRIITYITSKVIFRDILVLERRYTDDLCYTLVAVKKENINILE